MNARPLPPEVRKSLMKSFVDDFVLNVDLFTSAYCGRWLRGQGTFDTTPGNTRRLVVDMISACKDQSDKTIFIDLPMLDELGDELYVLAAVGAELPKNWYIVDRAVGEKAYAIGERRWGENWLREKGDGVTYDIVMQEALLGEVLYG